MPKRKSVNHSFFSEWSEEMAYTLGFWVSDGCAKFNGHSYYISYAQKNRKIIERIKALTESQHKIYHTANNAFILEYASGQTYQDLCAILGMDDIKAKSLTVQFPVNLPNEYARHFVRGVVDGDGCLHRNKRDCPGIKITTGSRLFAFDLWAAIHHYTGICGSITFRKKSESFSVNFYSKNARKLARWLYETCSISLDRKRTLATEFFEEITDFDMPTDYKWDIKADINYMFGLFKDEIDNHPEDCTITRNAQSFVGMATKVFEEWGLT